MLGLNKYGQEGRKEMFFFYLTTHSTHFILRLYGVGHMVKDHSDSERGNLLPPHGLDNERGNLLLPQMLFYMHHPTAFVTPNVWHWLEREIAQYVHYEGLIRRPIAPWANTLTIWSLKIQMNWPNDNLFLTIIETLDWICVGFVLFVNWRVPMALLIIATLKAYTVHKITYPIGHPKGNVSHNKLWSVEGFDFGIAR